MSTDTKICATCKQEKPVDKFYLHKPSGKPEKHCKKCKVIRQRHYKDRPSNVSGVPHENDIIKALRKRGIYACSGKRSRSRWVDIVAFGCVAIEGKLGRVKNGGSSYEFTFTKKQCEQGIRGDIVIFMIEQAGQTIYYLLRKSCPSLYDINGDLKPYIYYTPDSTHANADTEMIENMTKARDNWQLILEVLNEKIQAMKQGKEVDQFATW